MADFYVHSSVPASLTIALQRLGHDVLAETPEAPDRETAEDNLLRFAFGKGRIFLTCERRRIRGLHFTLQVGEDRHCGIVVAPQVNDAAEAESVAQRIQYEIMVRHGLSDQMLLLPGTIEIANFHADQSVPQHLVEALSGLGHSVIIHERVAKNSERNSDGDLLRLAAGQDRTLLTCNWSGFKRVHLDFQTRDEAHSGIFVVPVVQNPSEAESVVYRMHYEIKVIRGLPQQLNSKLVRVFTAKGCEILRGRRLSGRISPGTRTRRPDPIWNSTTRPLSSFWCQGAPSLRRWTGKNPYISSAGT